MAALLEITDFNVHFALPDGEVHAVKNASLTIQEGECLGVVGESGSGKSQLFLAAFGLLAANGRASGSVKYRGEEILGASPKRLNALRGGAVTMIFQDPLTSLTPHMKVGAQITEALMLHRRVSRAEAENKAREMLDIAIEQRVPVMVASQGGPREHLARFRSVGTKWLHVVASVEHAKKAEAAGVDALVVDGAEAGGHPPPSEVGTLVLVRRVVKAVKLPVVASGGVADGAGVAALLALGAEAVQLGTRFIATPEASVHDNYKKAVLAADVGDTALVGRGGLPIRQLQNSFSRKYAALEASGGQREELEKMFKSSSLKQAALDGDVEWGKVEAGQSAGLVDDILPAADVLRRLVREAEEARRRLAAL